MWARFVLWTRPETLPGLSWSAKIHEELIDSYRYFRTLPTCVRKVRGCHARASLWGVGGTLSVRQCSLIGATVVPSRTSMAASSKPGGPKRLAASRLKP